MKIIGPKQTQSTVSQSISLGDTYRYISLNSRYGWRTVNYWEGMHIPAINVVGQGVDGYSCAMIPCYMPFYGSSTKVRVRLSPYVTNSKVKTFRWAITNERDDNSFISSSPSTSSKVLAQGTFTASESQRDYDFPVKNLPSLFYIYLWRYSGSYGNIHINSPTVTVYYNSEGEGWIDATPYVYTNSGWKAATPYVYKNGTWKTVS